MLKYSLQTFESLFLIWCERLSIYGNSKQQTPDVSLDFGYQKSYDRITYNN